MVIVGGGFGGLYAARALAHRPVRVTLLDRRNHHLFQPLLYQVATAVLNASDIAVPLRSVLRRATNITVLLAEVEKVELANRRLVLDRGEMGYDALVLAAGASHSYFGHDEWEMLAPGLKTLEDALEIRRRVLLAYEAAEREQDGAERQALLTFVVVGGGPTGVELAGALGEISRQTIARDFRLIDPTKSRIVLLEGGSLILPTFPESLSRSAADALRRIGVEVRVRAIVTRVTPDAVWLGGEQIRTRTVLWAAGVAATPLARTLGVPLDRSGRVLVEPDLSIPVHPEAFVVGDMCAFLHQTGAPLPGVAPVAIQQGRAVADNVLRRLRDAPTRPFRYRDRGSMATIGRAAAVAVVGRLKLSGLVAWLAWLFVHIMFLIGFRNRFLVLFEWAWAYVTWHRGARLITGPWRGRGAARGQ
ncbi:MAG: FAD-dependent oxidoreductase [Candidatus Rokuibacteriota bacterium]|nr:MAG: FAD-dependent oxidoreductase [Candidatus Rokubacteria bacterium]PYM62322.1 MAG: FAD-dependent oxidoreductase [Candidatus Rokubacteria bacterium]PYN68827.1 MAG: FAD-dependent oxidoreductase [Candidatus Rokubacteria bacterium]